jgi:tetratricopeptide (TPR) repeat protein
MTFNVSLGMIVRNEGRTLKKCLESVAPHVQEIVIGLAGESTDNTLEIIKEWNKVVEAGHTPIRYFDIEWVHDFSAARNRVLEAVKGDYFLWLDGDDELVGADQIQTLIRKFPNVDAFYAGYDYARDENDNCICYLVRERLVRLQDELPNRGWKWIGKIHEVMVADGFQETQMFVDGLVVKHHKPAGKHSPDRNLEILYAQLAEQEPNPDPRILGYLCTEMAGRGNFKEALMHGRRFVKLSGWNEEKYQMQHRMADMYRAMGEYPQALKADFDAIAIQPDWPDAFLGLAETYAALNQYKSTIEWSKAATTKTVPRTFLIVNPLDYSYTPALIIAGAYIAIGDFEMALENYKKAYSIRQEPIVLKQIKMLERELYLHKAVDAFLFLREFLGRHDEWLKVRKLYDVVPKYLERHPQIMDTWDRTMVQTAHVIDPKIMEDFYINNPNWTSVSDEQILGPDWLEFPRVKFALDTAKRIGAKTIVDWGCSDGFISLPVAKALGAHVTGFDLDPRCVELAALRANQWGVDARFQEGNVDQIGEWEGDKADLAIFFEVIEHVVDPAQTLEKLEKTAKHIAMTTPFMAWENGNLAEWDRQEPKGHLRIFDQFDIEKLLWDRGRIHNLYRQPWGTSGWLFADYEVGAKYKDTVVIGAFGAPEPWNPRTFETTGLGGSETAAMKLAENLAATGSRAIVYSNIDEPGYYNGAGYRPQKMFKPEMPSDLFIAWRYPEAADLAINTKKLVLWMHDTDVQERLTPARAKAFDAIVVLTKWHRDFMMKLYPFLKEEQFVIIGNGVDSERFNQVVHREPHRVIYSSSPDRGLDIILESIWPKVVEVVPDAELHIYYGWNNVDKFIPSFPQLGEFKNKILGLLANSTGVTFHGRVDQHELAKAFQKSSVWLYPTHFSETYCISAIEAQLAGAIPITNHLAALTETVKSGVILSQDVRNPEVQELYAKAVVQTLLTPLKERTKIHSQVKRNAPANGWDWVAAQWRSHFLKEN